MARKPTQLIQLKVRMQEALRKTIEQRAKKSGRSLNGEIVAILEAASRAEETERQFAELKADLRKLNVLIMRGEELRAITQKLDRIRTEKRATGSKALTDEERALWKRLEETSGQPGLLAEEERKDAERPKFTPEESAEMARIAKDMLSQQDAIFRKAQERRRATQKDEPS